MSGKGLFGLLKDAFKEWGEDKASRLGAALAYYTIFSIGPLLVVMIAVAGFVFGKSAAQGQIVDNISSAVGENGANMIQQMIKSASDPRASTIASIIGVVTLLLGAAGIFGQLKDSLNTVWKIRPKTGGGIMAVVSRNLLSFLMVLGVCLLLIASLVVNAVLASVSTLVQNALPGGAFIWQIVNYLVTFGLMTLLFAMVYKVLPDAKIAWSSVWTGAAVTSVLFILGQIALGIYFSLSNPGTAFGAAGSLVLVLVWIYYSAQILLLGAEITQVYSKRSGPPVSLSRNAEWATADVKASREAIAARSDGRVAEPAERSSPWFR